MEEGIYWGIPGIILEVPGRYSCFKDTFSRSFMFSCMNTVFFVELDRYWYQWLEKTKEAEKSLAENKTHLAWKEHSIAILMLKTKNKMEIDLF